jgi:hypothetical protein
MTQSPFPGMDPYLEADELWPDFYHSFVEVLRAQINRLLAPRYYAAIDVQTVLNQEEVGRSAHDYAHMNSEEKKPPGSTTGRLNLAIAPPIPPLERDIPAFKQYTLRTIQVHRTGSNQLATVVEVFSPGNKTGPGLEEYRLKRWRVLNTSLALVEIDLLRGGTRPAEELHAPPVGQDYVILVCKGDSAQQPRRAQIWPVAVNKSLPTIPFPLLPDDPDLLLDLNWVMQKAYERGAFGRRIAYNRPVPSPALRPEMELWWARQARP